jgi:hypothetical protein
MAVLAMRQPARKCARSFPLSAICLLPTAYCFPPTAYCFPPTVYRLPYAAPAHFLAALAGNVQKCCVTQGAALK